MTAKKTYYPVNLDIKGRKCLVVGGGSVAYRKTKGLLMSGAVVKVVSPEFDKRFNGLNGVELANRKFRPGDLNGIFLAYGATDDNAVNTYLSELCKRKKVLVNVVDVPKLCTFIVPSMVRRGGLTISISTSGASPSLSKEIRKELERLYPKDFAVFTAVLNKYRGKAIKYIVNPSTRRKVLKSIGNGAVIRTLRSNGVKAAIKRIDKIVKEAITK